MLVELIAQASAHASRSAAVPGIRHLVNDLRTQRQLQAHLTRLCPTRQAKVRQVPELAQPEAMDAL
jgi:hypothetical protein